MTHTRRRYNLPGHLFWHPWRQHPNWHLRQDPTGRRAAWKAEERMAYHNSANEMSISELSADPLEHIVEIWYDYEDWLCNQGKYEPECWYW